MRKLREGCFLPREINISTLFLVTKLVHLKQAKNDSSACLPNIWIKDSPNERVCRWKRFFHPKNRTVIANNPHAYFTKASKWYHTDPFIHFFHLPLWILYFIFRAHGTFQGKILVEEDILDDLILEQCIPLGYTYRKIKLHCTHSSEL